MALLYFDLFSDAPIHYRFIPYVFYYTIASTVGYGDLATKTETGRTLAIIFIPFAVGIMGSLLEMVAGAIIDARRKKYESYLHNKPLTLRDIRVMDSDGDGNVTRAEFLQFMLVAMNQVDKGLLERLNHHFDQLDYDNSGTINKDDLATMAQQRMQQATGVSAMHHRQQQQQQAAFQRRSTRRTDNRQLPQYGSVV